jgi:hypothetical protein
VDQDGVGFGDVEADVRDVVGDQSIHHGKDRGLDNFEVDSWGECLVVVSLGLARCLEDWTY